LCERGRHTIQMYTIPPHFTESGKINIPKSITYRGLLEKFAHPHATLNPGNLHTWHHQH
jgi:hypothetical protein